MTADEFEMDCHYEIYSQTDIWEVSVRDGDMKSEFSVYDEDIQEAVRENFEYFTETIEKELTERAESDWDNSLLTDEEKSKFLEILRRILA